MTRLRNDDEFIKYLSFQDTWKNSLGNIFSSGINLRNQPIYQEVIVINDLAKNIEAEFEEYNKRARGGKKINGFFYHPFDKNVYMNMAQFNPYAGGHQKALLMDYRSERTHKIFNEIGSLKYWDIIYQHTKFLIQTQDSQAWFSFQFLPKDSKYLKRPFAIISAQNPNMLNDENLDNKELHDDLVRLLHLKKYSFYETVGELCGHIEDSVIIYDIQKDQAIKLGNDLHQESIVYNDGNNLSILKCSDSEVVLQVDHSVIYDVQ